MCACWYYHANRDRQWIQRTNTCKCTSLCRAYCDWQNSKSVPVALLCGEDRNRKERWRVHHCVDKVKCIVQFSHCLSFDHIMCVCILAIQIFNTNMPVLILLFSAFPSEGSLQRIFLLQSVRFHTSFSLKSEAIIIYSFIPSNKDLLSLKPSSFRLVW